MNFTYTITDTTLNQVAQFYQLIDRLGFFPHDEHWRLKLRDLSLKKQAFGAVAIGRNLTDNPIELRDLNNIKNIFNEASSQEFEYYLKTLQQSFTAIPNQKDLDLDLIESWFAAITGQPYQPGKSLFRTTHGVVNKVIWEHGIKKIIDFEVETKSEDIMTKMNEFLEWYHKTRESINPVVLAGIAHYKIAEIHPYPDANGRLSRLVSKFALLTHDLPEFILIAPEYYHYTHRDLYYEVIEKAVATQDLTQWLEYYSKALLSSVHNALSDLVFISGSSVDLLQRRVVDLTDRELEILEILIQRQQASAAEVGVELNVSRQNANVILKRLVQKGLLIVIGKSTSSRYSMP